MNDDFDAEAYYHIAYLKHDIMNPLADERLLWLYERCTLPAAPRLLDIGCGNGHAALLLARGAGARCTLVDSSPQWIAEAGRRFAAAGLTPLADTHCIDADAYTPEEGSYDIALCLGTAPVYGGFGQALRRLAPALRSGGYVIVGEPTLDVTPPLRYQDYLRRLGWELPSARRLLRELVEAGYELLATLRSTGDEWDRYMALQWQAIVEHADARPEDAQAQSFREWMRDEQEVYLRYQRRYVDWNVLLLRLKT
ncbi:MAG TPA: class I SAM-dependent methyltransferase [Bacteroidota bacterium]|nr:class I SAM-dependent methyltransferase [Bacteroidota bacterium]